MLPMLFSCLWVWCIIFHFFYLHPFILFKGRVSARRHENRAVWLVTINFKPHPDDPRCQIPGGSFNG